MTKEDHPAFDAAHRPDRLTVVDVTGDPTRWRRSDSTWCAAEMDVQVQTDGGPRWMVTAMWTREHVERIHAWSAAILATTTATRADPLPTPRTAEPMRGNGPSSGPWMARWKHRAEWPQGATHLREPDDATACGMELADGDPDAPSWTTDRTDPDGVTCPACQDAVIEINETDGFIPVGRTGDGQLVEVMATALAGGGRTVRIGGAVRDMVPGEQIVGRTEHGHVWRLALPKPTDMLMGEPRLGKSAGYIVHRTEDHMPGCAVDHDPASSACPPYGLRAVRS
jgi:hypothetical protein